MRRLFSRANHSTAGLAAEPSVFITPLSDTESKPETREATADDGMEHKEVVTTESFSNEPYQKCNVLRAAGFTSS